jgi:hypothetical protein
MLPKESTFCELFDMLWNGNADNGLDRVNNAGIAGEGSREGYEGSEDPEKFSSQLLKSDVSEWQDIYRTNTIAYYVSLQLYMGVWLIRTSSWLARSYLF